MLDIISLLSFSARSSSNIFSDNSSFSVDITGTSSSAGISEIFIDVRNQRSVDTSKFSCDLYEYLKNPDENSGVFTGEYMEGYAFALDMKNRLQKLSNETKGEK